MIKEVLVVEGKMDVVAIDKAVEADCIITGGFTLSKLTLKNIEAAYKRRGIIILTDPDSAGERIRRFLQKLFPNAKHAFVPREDATKDGDIGIEDASPAAIQKALAKVRTLVTRTEPIFTTTDLMRYGLVGTDMASELRAKVGEMLGVGYANAKTFLQRLNSYGVTRAEFVTALAAVEKPHWDTWQM